MGLHLGSSEKLKITSSGGGACKLIVHSVLPTVNNVRLLSSDNYVLKDVNGVYLVAKEDA